MQLRRFTFDQPPRHTWTHRPTMATIIQEMKNQPPPPTTSNPPPSCIPDVPRRPEICLRLIGGWVGVVEVFRRQYTLLVRNILLKAHRRLVQRAPNITSQLLAYNCTFRAKLQQKCRKSRALKGLWRDAREEIKIPTVWPSGLRRWF